MNGNPFYIEPANFMQGLSAIGEGLETRAGYMREKAKKREAEELQLKAKDVLTKGTPDEIAEFVAMNPNYAKAADTIVKPKSEKTKRDMAETSIMILSDPENAVNYLTKRAEMLVDEGADASGTLAMLKAATEGKKDLVSRLAENGLAYSAPEMFRAYKEQTASPDKTPEMKNYDRMVKDPGFAAYMNKKENDERLSKISEKTFSNASALRKEFLAQSSGYQAVRDANDRLGASAADPSPAGDLAIIFNYMKMLDPGSVVRESEFAVAAQSGSYGDRIQASVNKIMSGERLSPDMRADFLNKAKYLYRASESQHKKREEEYKRIAQKNSLPVDQVVVDLSSFDNGSVQSKFESLPDPKELQGKIIRDDETGDLLKSDGTQWVKVE